MKKAVLFGILTLTLNLVCAAQENISVATGISVLRNFSPQQGFFTAGQTVQAQVHFSPTQSAYAWVEYYLDASFSNNFRATAKQRFVLLPERDFAATGRLSYRHFSMGWKHCFKGGYNEEKLVSVYGLAGFGFLFARMQNTVFPLIDTAVYDVATINGEGSVRKLTVDLGLGAEKRLSNAFFLFGDVRGWLPASSNPSRYLHNQRNLPLAFMLSAGLRVLIGPEGK